MEKTLQRFILPLWPVIVLVASGWMVLRWYFTRMTDGSDDPLGLIALVACAWFAWREPRPGYSSRRLALATVGLVVLALLPSATPALLRALIWVMALAAVLARTAAWAGLLTYSLPVMASVQFFGGYPVRVAVTWAAAGLLRLLGLAVSPEATMLVWHHDRVLIDAPCSGLQMAWLAGLLALLAANVYALKARRTARLLLFGAAVTFAANVVRAAALFFLETQLRVSAEWMHDLVGLGLFALVVAAVLARAAAEREPLPATSAPLMRKRACPAVAAVFVFSATLVAARPFCGSSAAVSSSALQTIFPGWQMAPIGPKSDEMERLPLDARTQRFAAEFPGKLAVFREGPRTWIVRWVFRPTRKLHAASDCMRAAGYHVVPGRARVDAKGQMWSSFDAKRDGENLRVCERIAGPNGIEWTDVSAWFWDTVFDSDSGPWWAITEIEREPEAN